MATASTLHCLFTAVVEEQNDSYVIEIPKQEVELGALTPETVYQIALLESAVSAPASGPSPEPNHSPESDSEPDHSPESDPEPAAQPRSDEPPAEPPFEPSGPPVDQGETRVVEIDSIGDKGDGVARIDGGYVVIVADTEVGERVRVEMDQVRENVAFAEVVERLPYYE